MIESHTAVLEREGVVSGSYATEPYEAAWAHEAIFFVREHADDDTGEGIGPHALRVQISPDGLHWCDEGSELRVPSGGLGHVKVSHFGGWLRLAFEVPPGLRPVLTVSVTLKG